MKEENICKNEGILSVKQKIYLWINKQIYLPCKEYLINRKEKIEDSYLDIFQPYDFWQNLQLIVIKFVLNVVSKLQRKVSPKYAHIGTVEPLYNVTFHNPEKTLAFIWGCLDKYRDASLYVDMNGDIVKYIRKTLLHSIYTFKI